MRRPTPTLLLWLALAALAPGSARAQTHSASPAIPSRTLAAASTPEARARAAAEWRRRHPWPPWYTRPLVLGPPAPGLPQYAGPPGPEGDPVQTASAGEAPGTPAAGDYVAAARAGFSPVNRLYASARLVLRIIEPLYAVVVALLILSSGMASAMRDLAWRGSRGRYSRALLFLVLYSAVGFVMTFPLLWFEGYALEHRFMLSTQSFGGWLEDQLKGVLLEILVLGVIPLIALGTRAIERWPRSWWAWLSAASVPLIVFSMWAYPVLVEPAFHRFQPLQDSPLRSQILALAGRAGIPEARVFEVDRSEDTRKLNAYVTGVGSSHRIVLWDTAIQAFRRDELLFVTGHEIGHYRLRHIERGILQAVALTTVGFFLAWWMLGAAVRRYGEEWGLRGPSDLAALPLLVGILTLLATAGEPIANAWSRTMERDADVYGLEITRDNDAAARAFVRMAGVNRSDPDPPPIVRAIFYSHPTIVERIRLAETYQPWREGRPQRFYHGPVPAVAAADVPSP